MSGRPNCYFIIYIAPLHKNYSEALPTPVRLKRTVFKREKNERDKVLGKRQSSSGRPFQVEGPTTEKARFCLMEERAKGRRRRPWSDERRDRELIGQMIGEQSSRKIGRARPKRPIQITTLI